MSAKEMHTDLTIIILAGGKSSRMGQDKGFLSLGVDSFAKSLVEVAKSITSNVFISVSIANSHRYTEFGVPLVVDEFEEKGPIGGITSVLKKVKTPWFGLVTIDTPFVTNTTFKDFWSNREGREAVMYSFNERIHPLVALYHSSTIEKWQNAMKEGRLKVTALVELFELKTIELPDNRVQELKNINTPQDYQAVIASQ